MAGVDAQGDAGGAAHKPVPINDQSPRLLWRGFFAVRGTFSARKMDKKIVNFLARNFRKFRHGKASARYRATTPSFAP